MQKIIYSIDSWILFIFDLIIRYFDFIHLFWLLLKTLATSHAFQSKKDRTKTSNTILSGECDNIISLYLFINLVLSYSIPIWTKLI